MSVSDTFLTSTHPNLSIILLLFLITNTVGRKNKENIRKAHLPGPPLLVFFLKNYRFKSFFTYLSTFYQFLQILAAKPLCLNLLVGRRLSHSLVIIGFCPVFPKFGCHLVASLFLSLFFSSIFHALWSDNG